MLSKEKLKGFVPATNVDSAKNFYGEILGLSILCEDDYGLEFDANGTRLRISLVRELTPAPFTVLGWVVDDITKTVEALTEKGVEFERFGYFEQDQLGIWASPDGPRVAWFRDPDGNLLSVND
jgi:catechol 2,3-dioxygenase-like lactoylglutathione lyase family enzyme